MEVLRHERTAWQAKSGLARRTGRRPRAAKHNHVACGCEFPGYPQSVDLAKIVFSTRLLSSNLHQECPCFRRPSTRADADCLLQPGWAGKMSETEKTPARRWLNYR